jgi:hypothetical protein
MVEDKVIKRGYVKWTDSDGVFHKEPLSDHPELLADATDEQKLQAEEVRRLNEAGADAMAVAEETGSSEAADTLVALKAAPPSVLTAAQLDDIPSTEVVEPEVVANEVKVIIPAKTGDIYEYSDDHGDHTS